MEAYQVLESRFGKFISHPSENCVACSSGTAALHLAFEGLRLPRGSQVIMPEFTMVACARAAVMAGLRPTFVDCRSDDLLMDVDQVEEYITEQTSAILAVHIYGRRCNVGVLAHLAHHYGLKLVEDMAELHGVAPKFSDAAAWSFYKNKVIHGEEGGLVAFRSGEGAAIARSIRSHGFSFSHDFLHSPGGMNYRLSNLHADLILKSLESYQSNDRRRHSVAKWYNEFIPASWQMPPRDSCWVYDIRTPERVDLDFVVQTLNRKNIAARHSFKPMSEQPEFLGHHRHLNAYWASREIFYLPIQPGFTRDFVEWISKETIDVVSEACKRASEAA